jgi:hypothetical protein
MAPKRPLREKQAQIRFSDSEMASVERHAIRADMPVSTWIRGLVKKEIEKLDGRPVRP